MQCEWSHFKRLWLGDKGRLFGILGVRPLKSANEYYTNSQQDLESIEWIELTCITQIRDRKEPSLLEFSCVPVPRNIRVRSVQAGFFSAPEVVLRESKMDNFGAEWGLFGHFSQFCLFFMYRMASCIV